MKQNFDNLRRNVEDYLITQFSDYMESAGAKVMLGRIFGLLLTSYEPLSLSEIAERLQVSKPAVSNTIKLGVHTNMFKKVYNPDFPREDFYEMKVDFLEMMLDPGFYKLEYLKSSLEKSINMINSEDYESEEYSKFKERLDWVTTSFNIMLEEYELFSERIKKRFQELKDKTDIK